MRLGRNIVRAFLEYYRFMGFMPQQMPQSILINSNDRSKKEMAAAKMAILKLRKSESGESTRVQSAYSEGRTIKCLITAKSRSIDEMSAKSVTISDQIEDEEESPNPSLVDLNTITRVDKECSYNKDDIDLIQAEVTIRSHSEPPTCRSASPPPSPMDRTRGCVDEANPHILFSHDGAWLPLDKNNKKEEKPLISERNLEYNMRRAAERRGWSPNFTVSPRKPLTRPRDPVLPVDYSQIYNLYNSQSRHGYSIQNMTEQKQDSKPSPTLTVVDVNAMTRGGVGTVNAEVQQGLGEEGDYFVCQNKVMTKRNRR